MGYFFNALLAAAANVTQEVPIDGQTGVWVKLGTSVVASGMTISGYTLAADAARTMDIYSRGVATDITDSRGIIRVSNGGVLSALSVPGSAVYVRNVTVFNGGMLIGAELGGAGVNANISGGFASGVIVSSAANLRIYSGGTALAVTSNAGANIEVYAGGYIEYA